MPQKSEGSVALTIETIENDPMPKLGLFLHKQKMVEC